MSLNWNISKVANSEELYQPDGDLKPITKAIVFYTMIIDMGEITKKNAQEFATRVRMHHQALGSLLSNDYKITLRDIERHIGLQTNVFPMSTKKGFEKKLGAMIRERVVREVAKEAETPLTQMEESIRVEGDPGEVGGDDAARA